MSAHRLTSYVLGSELLTEFAATPHTEHDTVEIALLHLLAARLQLFALVNHTHGARELGMQAYTATDTPMPCYQQYKQSINASNVIINWRSSNTHLEHALAKLAERSLEHHAVNLNLLIENIIDALDRDLPAADAGSLGVDVGMATALPTAVAPLQLLHWVFSELLITSWFNSLPLALSTGYSQADSHQADVATVAISCLDADDSWHVTISSDHHHTNLAAASLVQLKMAAHYFGGDVYVASDDDVFIKTVVLPKHPRIRQ